MSQKNINNKNIREKRIKHNDIVLLTMIWKNAGGLETVNRDIVSAFVSMGWKVKVFSVFGVDDDKGNIGFKLKSFCPKNKHLRYLWKKYLWQPVVAWHVKRSLPKGGLLICGHAHLLPILSKITNANVRLYDKLAWIYGIDVWGLQAQRWKPYLNNVDRVASISTFTAEQVSSSGMTTPISIVPCSVDVNLFVPTLTPSNIRRNEVLICARMAANERYKGHQVLFESISIAELLLGHRITVRVIGSGNDRLRLEGMVRDLGLTDRVLFTGRISEELLIEAYQHCGVFCMPSYVEKRESGYWTGEGFGLVYVEAAACGRPVIASRDGGSPETIVPEETGLLVDPLSPESVGRAIAKVLSDPVLADEMGRRGRLLAERCFSKEKFLENVKKLTQSMHNPNRDWDE